MVMTFFRRGDGDGGLDLISSDGLHGVRCSTQLRYGIDCAPERRRPRHRRRGVGGPTPASAAEQELRGQLVVHVSVQGSGDIGEVLGLILLIKKIEQSATRARTSSTWPKTVQISATPRISICSSATDGRSARCSAGTDILAQADEVGAASSGNCKALRRNSRVTSGI